MITRRRHPATRPAMGLLAGVGLALSLLAPVAGHAALLLANPPPGTGLPQAPAAVVGFLRPDIPAWFRVWIGEDGLVRREAMRPEGHIMDHAFTDLNGQVQIEPPR